MKTTKQLLEQFHLEGKITENHAKEIEDVLNNSEEERIKEEKRVKIVNRDEFESILAEVIDDLYLRYKQDFCNWEARVHKLGMFKEAIKYEVYNKLNKKL